MSGQAVAARSQPSRILARFGLRGLMVLYAGTMQLARVLGRVRRPPPDEGLDILLTGTFHSPNWLLAHLAPLARSRGCARVRMVSATPVPPIEKVEGVYPPAWLPRLVGRVPARLLVFFWAGLRRQPDVVGGFHLLLNGLAAALLARLTGSRSLYFCVGGPAEVQGGGIRAENRLFALLKHPDPVIEGRLLRAVDEFDVVIVMGAQAVDYFQAHGARPPFRVVPGGLDRARFSGRSDPPDLDVVLVGRLSPVKRIDLFLQALQILRRRRPGLKAAVLGDGQMRASLEGMAHELGLDGCVTFAGHQAEVGPWLRRAKVFALTSETEGLSLSLMEAMLCGLPAVVPAVGDLGSLVEDGVNGYLVRDRTPECFAARILDLLEDPDRRARFAAAACQAAQPHELGTVTALWDEILGSPPIRDS